VKRPRLGAQVACWLLVSAGATLLAQEAPADFRREIDRLAYQLDESVRQVCRPSPLNLFGPTQVVRGYRIPGVGVVFVVPPRSLPSARTARSSGSQARPPAQPAAVRAAPPRAARAFAPASRQRRAPGGARMSDDEQAELALRAFEEQVRSMDEAAARMHQGVQQAMTQMMREVEHSNTGDVSARAASEDAREGFPPLLLLPPWSQSWGSEVPSDPRPAQEVVHDVRAALASALAAGAFAGLPPDESLVVTVEFFTEDSLDISAHPTATLVERLKTRDIDTRKNGAPPAEEIVKRVEISQF
jgi:hypothetical protein